MMGRQSSQISMFVLDMDINAKIRVSQQRGKRS